MERELASKASDRLDERMQRYHAKKTLTKFTRKEIVFVRSKKRKGKKRSDRVIESGTVIRRYKDEANYNLRIDEPNSRVLKSFHRRFGRLSRRST